MTPVTAYPAKKLESTRPCSGRDLGACVCVFKCIYKDGCCCCWVLVWWIVVIIMFFWCSYSYQCRSSAICRMEVARLERSA